MADAKSEFVDLDQLWDYDNPEETERRFRQLLPEVSQNRAYYVELLTQIARSQGLQRRFEDAHKTLDEAQNMLTPDLQRTRIRYLLERGRVFNSSQQPHRARPLFLEAFELTSASGEDFCAIDAAHMMGIIEPTAQQIGWNLKALELAQKRRIHAQNNGWAQYTTTSDGRTTVKHFTKRH